jgi:fibronectin type 3 domain-containing protein
MRLTIFIALLAVGFTAVAQTPRSATITFSRPTQYTDGTSIAAATALSYKVYAGAKGSASKPVVATVTSTTATVNTGLPAGETCVEVSVVANGVESSKSNEACKTFPFPATEAVTITVQ